MSLNNDASRSIRFDDDRLSRERIQVLVVGAGVAGCATALMLSEAGQAVMLAERTHSDSALPDFGESITPSTLRDLVRMGLDEAEVSFGRRTYGVQSAWGSDVIATRSFAATVPGHGLHVDKQHLIRLLRDRIETTGAKIHYGCRLRIEHANSDGSHLVSLSTSEATIEATVEILVDATGRFRAVARKHTDILHYDRLIATAARGRGITCPANNLSPNMSFTEAVPDGWWYSASLLDGGRIVVRFSDEHEEVTRRLRCSEQFWNEVRQTQWTSRFFADAERESSIRVRSAATTALRQFSGPGWVAVGDAARTVDPLSSQGIHNGIRDGIAVAEAIMACGATPEGMVGMSDYLQKSLDEYFRQRSAVYGQETRWAHESFWKLRKD